MKVGDKVTYVGPRISWLKSPLEPGTVGTVRAIAEGPNGEPRPCPTFDEGRWGDNAVGVFVDELALIPTRGGAVR